MMSTESRKIDEKYLRMNKEYRKMTRELLMIDVEL